MILFVGDRKGLDLFPSELADESVDVIDDCISIDDIVSKTRSDKRYVIAVFDINFFEGYTDDKLLKAFYLFSHTSSAHLIILAQGRKSGDRFLSDLIEMNLYDFVNAISFFLSHLPQSMMTFFHLWHKDGKTLFLQSSPRICLIGYQKKRRACMKNW